MRIGVLTGGGDAPGLNAGDPGGRALSPFPGDLWEVCGGEDADSHGGASRYCHHGTHQPSGANVRFAVSRHDW